MVEIEDEFKKMALKKSSKELVETLMNYLRNDEMLELMFEWEHEKTGG